MRTVQTIERIAQIVGLIFGSETASTLHTPVAWAVESYRYLTNPDGDGRPEHEYLRRSLDILYRPQFFFAAAAAVAADPRTNTQEIDISCIDLSRYPPLQAFPVDMLNYARDLYNAIVFLGRYWSRTPAGEGTPCLPESRFGSVTGKLLGATRAAFRDARTASFLKINRDNGTRWLNRERLGDFEAWMVLTAYLCEQRTEAASPTITDGAVAPGGDTGTLEQLETVLWRFVGAMEEARFASGYQADVFLATLHDQVAHLGNAPSS